MAQISVNASCRGLALLSDASLNVTDAQVGFLGTDAPMPVGTALAVSSATGGKQLTATVASVVEQRKLNRGAEAEEPGMLLSFEEDPAALGAATGEAAEDPSNAVVITAELGGDDLPEEVRTMMDSSEMDPVEQPAPEEPAPEEPAPEEPAEPPKAPAKSKRRKGGRRKKKKTQG